MKSFATFLFSLLVTASLTVNAQSKSYKTLKEKFSGSENVFSFSTSGFLARTMLWMSDEHEFTSAIKDIKKVRLMVIPKEAFDDHNVSVAGFRKFLKKDSFEELASVRDHGDDVSIYLQTNQKLKDNRYMVLVDDDNEVIAIEITGYVDAEALLKQETKITYNSDL